MGTIAQDIIDQVRDASDIVQIIGEYISLKKRGRNYQALCPFHSEKTASFSVSADKQIFHCFGCGKGGNVYSFLMEHEHMSFTEAVKHLASKAGITIPVQKSESIHKEEHDRLYYANFLAMEYYASILTSDKYRRQINKYLTETRKITKETIDFFHLGLAGEEWDGFLQYALKKGLFPNELIKAGLVIHSEKNDKHFDRFRHRLMIPIFSLSEKPIAFGGRTLKKGEPAKYINSPETPLYSKSNILYGLNFSRQEIREKKEVIIVEGYFDFISLFQSGIKNVAASSGTAFTAQQARLLSRFAEKAYLFFDADSAGQQAAVRSVDALYDAGIEVMVMIPPDGEDPDSVARIQRAEGIEKLRNSAVRYLPFRVRNIDLKKLGIIEKEKIIKELAELGGRIGDITRRRLFFSEAADILGIGSDYFYRLASTGRPPAAGYQPLAWSGRKETQFEGELLSLLINFPHFIESIMTQIASDDFQDEQYRKLYSCLIEIFDVHGEITINRIVDLIADKSLAELVASLGQMEWDPEKARQIINDYILKITDFKREKIIDKLKLKLKLAEQQQDFTLARELAEEITSLINQRNR